jgi:hypothetical protein
MNSECSSKNIKIKTRTQPPNIIICAAHNGTLRNVVECLSLPGCVNLAEASYIERPQHGMLLIYRALKQAINYENKLPP